MDKYSNLSPKEYTEHLSAFFALNRDQESASQMKKYMKDHFAFFGLRSEERLDLTRAFYKNYGLPNPDTYKAFVLECWDEPHREMQYTAMELTFKYRAHWEEDDIDFIHHLITHKKWWDSVDYIASNIVGMYFLKYHNQIRTYINRWKRSDDIWLNRTAILFQLKYKHKTNFELLTKVIDPHLDSEEFFLQKAIGWALRQYGKYEPKIVIDYVKKTNLKPLSQREAMKHLKA